MEMHSLTLNDESQHGGGRSGGRGDSSDGSASEEAEEAEEEESRNVELNIWDTSGEAHYLPLVQQVCVGHSSLFLLVIKATSATDANYEGALGQWLDCVQASVPTWPSRCALLSQPDPDAHTSTYPHGTRG